MTMKINLTQFLELYKPKAKSEQDFVDKHVVVKHGDRNGNKDDVFKASKVKTVKRATEHGYDPGDDEKVYEETNLHEGKMSLNKVNIVHHHDHPAAKEFARHYTKGMKGDYREGGPTEADDKHADAFHTRYSKVYGKSGFAGSGTSIYKDQKTNALWKVDRHANGKTFYGTDHLISPHIGPIPTHEETQLDELSKKTLGSYIKKAHDDGKKNSNYNWYDPSNLSSNKTLKKEKNRERGISRAVNKLTNESIDMNSLKKHLHEGVQLDELSKKTLKSYINRSSQDLEDRAYWAGREDSDKKAKPYKNYPAKKQSNRVKGINKAAEKLSANPKTPKKEVPQKKFWVTRNSIDEDENRKLVGHTKKTPFTSFQDAKNHIDNLWKQGKRNGHRIHQSNAKGQITRVVNYDGQSQGYGYAPDAFSATHENHLREMSSDKLSAYADKALDYVENKKNKDKRKLGNRVDGIKMASAKLTKEDIIDRTIAKLAPEDYTPKTDVEKLVDRLTENNVGDAYIKLIVNMYESLNDDNKRKLLSLTENNENHSKLIDFALEIREE